MMLRVVCGQPRLDPQRCPLGDISIEEWKKVYPRVTYFAIARIALVSSSSKAVPPYTMEFRKDCLRTVNRRYAEYTLRSETQFMRCEA